MSNELIELKQQFEEYLKHKIPGSEEVRVSEISQIHGGASRETYRLLASWKIGNEEKSRRMILRRDPEGSLIETDRQVEYIAYSTFYSLGIPVPEPLYIERDPKWLGRPFFVMEEIVDAEVSSFIYPLGPLAEKIGKQFWHNLGKIAAVDPEKVGLTKKLKVVPKDQCWKHELDYWEKVIDEDQLNPEPIVRGAIRWLRNNPPPPAQKLAVVHGDYRVGNFLYNEQGDICAILDWEMCHLGDPYEDIAWASDPMWSHENYDRPGNMIERKEAFRIWEEASGMKIDYDALKWWEIFSFVKGIAIWTSAAKEYLTGKNKSLILAWSGFHPKIVQNRLLAQRMSQLAKEVIL